MTPLRLLGIILATVIASQGIHSEEKTETFSVGKGGSLTVRTDVGDIAVVGWNKGEVTVRVAGLQASDLPSLSITKTGKNVTVDFDPPSTTSSPRFTVNVPSEFAIDIKTAGGNLSVEGQLRGTLNGSTAGGDITLGSLGGELTFRTAGGDITAGAIDGSITLKSAGGDLRTGAVTGAALLSTAGGDINAGNVGKGLTAKTAGGKIVAGDVGGALIATTAGGEIEIRSAAGTSALKTAGGNIRVSTARGALEAKTAGGDLDLQGVVGSVRAETAGGDILVDLTPGDHSNSRLSTAAGDVSLRVPAADRLTIEARIRGGGGFWNEASAFTIRSDFKTDFYEKDDVKGEVRATITINGGGPTLRIESAFGNIDIKKKP
jgi:DUF4097 and DUF4098 domain-containing protein YvlB